MTILFTVSKKKTPVFVGNTGNKADALLFDCKMMCEMVMSYVKYFRCQIVTGSLPS